MLFLRLPLANCFRLIIGFGTATVAFSQPLQAAGIADWAGNWTDFADQSCSIQILSTGVVYYQGCHNWRVVAIQPDGFRLILKDGGVCFGGKITRVGTVLSFSDYVFENAQGRCENFSLFTRNPS